MSPPRKDPIPNQDKQFSTKKNQCLTSDVPPFLPGNKSFRNEKNNDNPEDTDTYVVTQERRRIVNHQQ